MYLKRMVACSLMTAALLACESDYMTDEAPAPSELGTEGAAADQTASTSGDSIVSTEAASRTAAKLGVNAKFEEGIRKTADDERVRVFVPEMAPSLEVPEGAQCGTQDARGAFLSCSPGTYCLKASSEAASGVCVASAPAPRNDG
jgi:hypothetical protein